VRLLLDVSAVPERPVGAGVYTMALARTLAREGDLDLHLLSRRDDAARWAELAPKAAVHPEVPVTRPARLAWEQSVGPRLAERLGIDVWHGPHYTMPVRLRCPAVVTVHDLTFFDHPRWHEPAKVVVFRQAIRTAARRAGALVAPSATTAERLAAVCPPAGPCLVAPHGVDHDRFRPAASSGADGDLARLAAAGVRPPYVAFAGTIEPRKDVPTLVRAFAALARRRPDLRLVLAGRDGWGVGPVREAVARSGVATRIQRRGWLPDDLLPALYRQAAAVAYPSLTEGFGLPALEALACGAPLVTTTGTAMAEVAAGAALLVPPRDPAGLAAALTRILDDAALADRLRAAGPVRAARYTWEAAAETHLRAYEAARRRVATAAVPGPGRR
jgi:glycosyltransferase involved in cell wall biosynthesis